MVTSSHAKESVQLLEGYLDDMKALATEIRNQADEDDDFGSSCRV